jgi:hypothetical protein
LRKEICSGLKLVDRRTLKMIKALLVEALAPEDDIEEQELYKELNKRSAAVKAGHSKLLTVEESRAAYEKRKAKRKK